MSLIRKSLISALSAVIIAGGRFLLIAILARRLSPAELGQFVYAQWIIDMAFMIVAFGINASATRYLAEYAHDPLRRAAFLRHWLPWAFMLPVLSGLVVVAGAILSGLILTLMGYAFLAVWAITTGWWAMQTSTLYGHQRFDLVLKSNLMFIAVIIPTALFIPIESGFTELLFLVMALASLLACMFGVRENVSILRGQAAVKGIDLPWSNIRTFSVNTWLVGLIGGLVWSRGELPLVRMHLGNEGVAQYTVALTLFFGAMQGIMLWVSGVAPHLTAEWGRGQKIRAIAIARRFSDVQLLVSSGIALLLTCFGPELLGFVFGSAYRVSAASLAILVLGLITLSGSAQNYLMQLATDAKFNRNVMLAGVIMLYLIAPIMIPWLGIAGAAISRAFTMWGMFLISLFLVWRLWGGSAFSGRNIIVAIFTVLVPALTLFEGGNLIIRILVSVPCLAALVLLVRGEDGGMVATDVLCTLWHSFSQWVAGIRGKSLKD